MAEGAKGAARRAPGDGAVALRAAGERAGDHAAIGRLTDELLPSLIAKLGASGLGELEVREGEWHVRLRGLGTGSAAASRGRAGADRADRAGRSQPGHEGHGHAPAALEGQRHAGGAATGHGDGHGGGLGGQEGGDDHRAIATSPAVGIFQPRNGVTAGTKVRAGDRIGHVDMLGVPHDVVAPVDGIVGASLVEPGQAVEYGQELIRIELATPKPAGVG